MTVYTTRAAMKTRLGILDDDSDVQLDRRIASASYGIEGACNRGHKPGFGLDEVASARLYRPAGRTVWERGCDGELLFVDDIGAIDGLVVEVGDGTDWTDVTDQVTPEPLNAIAEGEPVTGLALEGGRWTARRVRVTIRWGWPAIPPAIEEATEILTERLFRRKDAPWGVAGFGEQGAVRVAQTDPDVQALIGEFERTTF